MLGVLWCAMSARGKLTDMMTLMLGFHRDARGATGCYGVLSVLGSNGAKDVWKGYNNRGISR